MSITDSAVFISSSSRDRVDHDVFISYSRRDGEFARRLLTALKGENRDAWVDWQAIEAAEDFWKAIEIGIEAANTFVFILSPASVASVYCNKEVDHAVTHNKRLIPVVCQEVDVNSVHPALRPLDWIFLRETDAFEPGFARLVKAIDTDLPYVRMHTRLQVKAIEWNKRGRDDSFLLRKRDLSDAETWLTGSNGKEPTPTALQQEYITTSRTVEDEYNQLLAKGEQARKWVKVAAIVVPIAVAIASFAGFRATVAEQRAIVADQNVKDAVQKAMNAETRVTLADKRAIVAVQKAKRADQNTAVAESRRKGADQQRMLAETKLMNTETKRIDAERKENRAEHEQKRAQITLEKQETKLVAINNDLQQKKQNLRDVWRLSDALAESAQGHKESALKILDAVLQKHPRSTLVMLGQGYLYAGMEDYPKAEVAFRRAMKIDHDDPTSWVGVGVALSGQNKFDSAVEAYQRAIKLDPNYAAVYYNLGNTLYNQNKFDLAVEAYQQAIKLDPMGAASYNNLGNTLSIQNKLDAAVETLQQAIRLDSRYASAYNNLGNVLSKQNKLDEAIATFNQAISIDPNLGVAYANRGEAYFKQKRYQEALTDLNRAIELGYKKEWDLQLREQVRERLKEKG